MVDLPKFVNKFYLRLLLEGVLTSFNMNNLLIILHLNYLFEYYLISDLLSTNYIKMI